MSSLPPSENTHTLKNPLANLTNHANLPLSFLESSYKRKEIPVNIRVIAATNIEPKKAIEDGRFKADLYHRLNEFLIQIPPLRERSEDITLLVDHFIRVFNEEMKKKIKGISPEALKKLVAYPWPGNVRELKNAIKRCMVVAGKRIAVSDLPAEIKDVSLSAFSLPHNMGLKNALKEVTRDAEKKLIIDALKMSGGKRSAAAKILDIDEKTLYNKMKEHEIFWNGGVNNHLILLIILRYANMNRNIYQPINTLLDMTWLKT